MRLDRLTAGMAIPFGGDRVTHVSAELARVFVPGDALLVGQTDGELMRVPREVRADVDAIISRATEAFRDLRHVKEASIGAFFDDAASRLADDEVWKRVLDANARDVVRARSDGRSIGRLALSDASRDAMVRGLLAWADLDIGRRSLIKTLDHDGWRLAVAREPVGIVGFVFEARPNVIIDALGVLRSGNVALLKFGHDARATAECLVSQVIAPALVACGLPVSAVSLIDSANHAATWAMLSDRRLGLAVLRGSGRIVSRLGGIARQNGVPMSLHGTGGAWLVAGDHADAAGSKRRSDTRWTGRCAIR